MSTEFYICDTDEQNFIFGIIVSARLNLDLSLHGTDCANTLRCAKFRLPRRMNFRSPARLNLKPNLAIKFKACFLELDRAPQNFKIYRASSIRRVNLDTAFAA